VIFIELEYRQREALYIGLMPLFVCLAKVSGLSSDLAYVSLNKNPDQTLREPLAK